VLLTPTEQKIYDYLTTHTHLGIREFVELMGWASDVGANMLLRCYIRNLRRKADVPIRTLRPNGRKAIYVAGATVLYERPIGPKRIQGRNPRCRTSQLRPAFFNELSAKRASLGITTYELAQRLGMSRSQVARAAPNGRHIKKLQRWMVRER
jgi:hypothetical protein